MNDIAIEQTKATEKMQATTNQMLDYLATHPDATIRYHASEMVLQSIAMPLTSRSPTHGAVSEVCFS
jgi:hypothetical protein